METLEKLYQKANLYTPKQGLYYAVALDKNNNYLGEILTGDSYCKDCIIEAKEVLNKILKDNPNEFYFTGNINEVDKIVLWEEYSPESDDFVRCENCDDLIETGVLHTYTGEIDYWLSDEVSLEIDKLSNINCYIISELIKNHPQAELIDKLKEKLQKHNLKTS